MGCSLRPKWSSGPSGATVPPARVCASVTSDVGSAWNEIEMLRSIVVYYIANSQDMTPFKGQLGYQYFTPGPKLNTSSANPNFWRSVVVAFISY